MGRIRQMLWTDYTRQAWKDSVPVMTGYIPIGIVFGFFAMQSGLPAWVVIASSVFVYAGASQFMMVPMAVAGMPLSMIAFATFVINLRHVFYGVPLLNRIASTGWKRWYSVYAITDETFSIAATFPKGTSEDRMFALCLINHFWWVLGTLIGVIVGAQAKIALFGTEFVLCCLFAMLATEQWRARKTAWPLWCALVFYPLARFFCISHALSLSIGGCVLAGLIWGRLEQGGRHGH